MHSSDFELLRKVFPNENLSNCEYHSSDKLNMPPEEEYYALKKLQDIKNHLIQLANNMSVSLDRKREIITAINNLYGQYISDQQNRENANKKFNLNTHREEKTEKIDQSELDLLKEKYSFDEMSEEEQEEFMEKFNERLNKTVEPEELIDRVEGHRIM